MLRVVVRAGLTHDMADLFLDGSAQADRSCSSRWTGRCQANASEAFAHN